MTIVFMGTPEFAVPSLKTLLDSKHRVAGVVTIPDKPAGRGQKMTCSAVKKTALQHGLFLMQPENLSDPAFVHQLKSLNADCFVVVAFRILPEVVFTLPPKGTFNLHASLLPAYRGAAPLNWVLINGEAKTGVTTFLIEKSIDTGQILKQHSFPLDEEITAGELHDHLSHLGAQVVLETADGIEEGSLDSKKQVGETTKAPKITKELGIIDWCQNTRTLHNLIRGLSPFPGCSTRFHERLLKVLRTRITDVTDKTAKPGTILAIEKNGELLVKTGNGALSIVELKPEGKRSMTAAEFCRGYSVKAGEILES